MPTVHTAHGPGEIVQTETVRGRTQYKVAGPGFEVWLDETRVAAYTPGDPGQGAHWEGYPDPAAEDPRAGWHTNPEGGWSEPSWMHEDEGFDGGRAGEIFNNAPQGPGYGHPHPDDAPHVNPHFDALSDEDPRYGDPNDPSHYAPHEGPEPADYGYGDEAYSDFDGGRSGEIFNNAPHSFGRSVDDASADAHRLGWAPVDHDNSVNLPYNPDPQYPAIPGDTESTIQPIHEIDADERLESVDSVTFEHREYDEGEDGDGPGPSADNFAKSGAFYQAMGPDDIEPTVDRGAPTPHQTGPWGLDHNAPELREYAHPDFAGEEPGDFGDFGDELGDALSPPVYDNPGYNKHAPGYDPHRDLTRWEDGRQGSYHEANPALMAILPELIGGGEAAGAAGGAAGMGGKLKGLLPGAMGGQNQVPGNPEDLVNTLRPEGWGQLIPTASTHEADWRHLLQEISQHPSDADFTPVPAHDWLAQHPKYMDDPDYEPPMHRPAGLDHHYIDITADADYHHDPVIQFRHDPVAFINRVGHVEDEGLNPRMAQYMDLVEADHHLREAAWADVRKKAMRLKSAGAVQVKDLAPDRIYASVDGDNGVYDVMIAKSGAFGGFGGGHSISNWRCSCEWGKWAFKRRLTYVGRLCSHGYAAYLTMQSAHMKDQPRMPRQTRLPRRKRADALQNVPTRLVPDLVVNDTDDQLLLTDVDVTKDERKTTGPDDIVHFAQVMAYCDKVRAAYPRELVAFLYRYADPVPAPPSPEDPAPAAADAAAPAAPAKGDPPGTVENAFGKVSPNLTGKPPSSHGKSPTQVDSVPGNDPHKDPGDTSSAVPGSAGAAPAAVPGIGGINMGDMGGLIGDIAGGVSSGVGAVSDLIGSGVGALTSILGSTDTAADIFHSRYTDGNGRYFQADDQSTQDWKIDDASDAGSALNEIRDWATKPQEEDFGHMQDRVEDIRDAVERAREDGVDADQLVASRRYAEERPGSEDVDYDHPAGTVTHAPVPDFMDPDQGPATFTPADQSTTKGVDPYAGGPGQMPRDFGSPGGGDKAPGTSPLKAEGPQPGQPGSSVPATGNQPWQHNTDASPISGGNYTVTQGDTLADIAQRSGYGDDYSSLAQSNSIANPDQINVGQQITLDPSKQPSKLPGQGGGAVDMAKPGGGVDTGVASGGSKAGGGGVATDAVSTPPVKAPASDPVAPTTGTSSTTSGDANKIGYSIFADRQDYEDWFRYAYPEPGDHQPFNGSGPAGPLEIGTSEDYVKRERAKHDDLADTSAELRHEGGVRRLGNGSRRAPVVPEVVREQHPRRGGKVAAHIPVDDYDPLAPKTALLNDDSYFSEDLAGVRLAAEGGDIVAAFQRNAANSALAADAGRSNDDIADAAIGFLRTAGRNFSLAEQHDLIREGDIGGAGNLDSLDLRDTHYEAMNSVGLW